VVDASVWMDEGR